MGVDILCQAVSGMGKTAVFVLSVLHCLGESPEPCSAMVLCHTRELAYQIKGEFVRLSKFMPNVRTEVILGGEPLDKQKKMLKSEKTPHIIVGTPGRVLHLAKDKTINLDNLKMFILDECDKVLENVGKCQPILPPHLDLCLRHAFGHLKHLQEDPSFQTSYDVHGYSLTRDQGHLPQVHAQPC